MVLRRPGAGMRVRVLCVWKGFAQARANMGLVIYVDYGYFRCSSLLLRCSIGCSSCSGAAPHVLYRP